MCDCREDWMAVAVGKPEEILRLDEALRELAEIDPVRARIVELRYFGGAQVQEIARVLEISTATVNRYWRSARAWLQVRLGPGDAS